MQIRGWDLRKLWQKMIDNRYFCLNTSLFYNTPKKESVVNRTKKLFYVCCTRAKENLVVYYPGATANIIEGARAMFGEISIKRI